MIKPLIGLACDLQMQGKRPLHSVNEKYATSVIDAMNGVPLLIPALSDRGDQSLDLHALLGNLDGVIVPGGYSNVEPYHYGATGRPDTLHDPRRDSLTLKLIPAAIELAIPLLAICRGLQEMNVVYGGTLHQHVHELDDKFDHRENDNDPLAVQYDHAHAVNLAPKGLLHRLYGKSQASVNSLHGQGVQRLGDGLRIEATADDGLVEAFTDPNAPAFNLAVQWHPEYKVTEDAFYMAIYHEFTTACNKRRRARADN